MSVDEAGDGGLSAPVEDRLARGGRFPEGPDELLVRPAKTTIVPSSIRSAASRTRRTAPCAVPGARRPPFGRRQLGEMPDRGRQPGSPSRFFGR